MFSLLFYAPLLLQGGFALSPKITGMLITPLVVFVTIGSIINGYVITRIHNATRMLQLGFLLLSLAIVGIIFTYQDTPHWHIVMYLLTAGLGLGFIFPNITVFTQEVAGRAHLGIATALLQSLRMMGGMVGTAAVGTVVSHGYITHLHTALKNSQALQWLADLHDPQLLINVAEQARFQQQTALAGWNGNALLASAREGLVAAIHHGQFIALAISVLALWLVRRVPPIHLTPRRDKVPGIDIE
jgi:MFS family permease